ncbi:MAG TPA: hypothetical protein ENG88_00500 [Nitrospirae bacterium]|nr:hypothetical protein [Nitrospirota bacterium]
MNLVGIASRAGVNKTCLENLINNGKGSNQLAKKLGTRRANITKFIEGTVSPGIAAAIGTSREHSQELRDKIGREGAIGIIIGLVCGLGSLED